MYKTGNIVPPIFFLKNRKKKRKSTIVKTTPHPQISLPWVHHDHGFLFLCLTFASSIPKSPYPPGPPSLTPFVPPSFIYFFLPPSLFTIHRQIDIHQGHTKHCSGGWGTTSVQRTRSAAQPLCPFPEVVSNGHSLWGIQTKALLEPRATSAASWVGSCCSSLSPPTPAPPGSEWWTTRAWGSHGAADALWLTPTPVGEIVAVLVWRMSGLKEGGVFFIDINIVLRY